MNFILFSTEDIQNGSFRRGQGIFESIDPIFGCQIHFMYRVGEHLLGTKAFSKCVCGQNWVKKCSHTSII